jgi:RND superfamily putative drug exporter
VRAALLDLSGRAGADPHFAAGSGPAVDVSADGRVSRLSVHVRDDADSDRAKEALSVLRTRLVPETVGRVPGAQYAVGGDTAASVDFSRSLSDRLPVVVTFVLGLKFLLVLWTFRSVVVAATAIVLNLLSVGAAYGLMVLVFQHTWAEGLLDFRSNGTIVAWLPMFLFVVLFGLSMDYHVFVVSRIRELALRGMPTRDAVRQGIVGSAGAVTSAAVVMVAVFAIFGTLSGLELKQLGVGLAAAVLLDATLVRAVLLPAAMTLLGRWNWWAPALLRRRRPVPEEAPGELVGV